MKGSTLLHQNLLKSFIKNAYKVYPDILILTNTVGVFRDFNSAERIIHSGIKGTPDLVVYGKNWFVFFDVKTGNSSFSKEQLAFKKRLSDICGKDVVFRLSNVEYGINIIKEFYDRNI